MAIGIALFAIVAVTRQVQAQRLPARASEVSTASPSGVLITQARIAWPAEGANLWWRVMTSPDDPAKLVACQLQSVGRRASFLQATVYGSDDAGESWRTLKSTSAFPANSEGTCVMGSHDHVYFSISQFPQVPKSMFRSQEHMVFWSSPDFGKSWNLGPRLPYTDAAVLAVLPGGAHDDQIFDVYSNLAGSKGVLARLLNVFESNGTQTRMQGGWPKSRCGAGLSGSGRSIDDLPPGTALWPARVNHCKTLVLIEGATQIDAASIGAVFNEWSWKPQRSQLTFSRLSANGKSMTTPIVIAPPQMADYSQWMKANAGSYVNEGTESSLAAGPAPDGSGSRIYVAWMAVVNNRPRIQFVLSSDGGATWDAPQSIDDSQSREGSTKRLLPSHANVAVNSQGIVAVTWAENAGDCWRFALSNDGGQHFDPSTALNPCDARAKPRLEDDLAGHLAVISNNDLSFGGASRLGSALTIFDMRGTYDSGTRGQSLAAARDGSFFATWALRSTQYDELHVAHITLAGSLSPLARHRESAMESARCCLNTKGTDHAGALDYTSIDYDPATHEFAIGVSFVVRRKDATWPLVLRLKRVTSRLGPLFASNADNRVNNAGAQWVLDGPGTSLPSSVAAADFRLLPDGQYQFSKPRVLRFRLGNPKSPIPAWAGREDAGTYVKLDVDILTSASVARASTK